MKSLKLKQMGGLLLTLCLVANFSFAQQKQEPKSEERPQKVVIIKTSEDGKVKTEKIVTEGEGMHEIRLNDLDGNVIVKEIGGENGKQIKVIVNPDDAELQLEQNVNVEVEEIDGEKQIKVSIQPMDGETKTFEWEGEGEIPADIREKLEADGIFIHGDHELDGENIFFLKGEDKGTFEWNGSQEAGGPFLGVVNAMESKVKIVVDENGEKQTIDETGPEEEVEGIRIGEVIEGSAADEAGLQKGDILKSIDGQNLKHFSDLVDFMEDAEVGQQISLTYERNGQLNQTETRLQERKQGMGQNVIIERIMQEGDENGEGNAFFLHTEDGTEAKIHTRHKVVVITRGDQSETTKVGAGTTEEALPELELKRDLELRDYKLFPNPADGNVQLRFSGAAVPTEIKISDLNGKQVYRERFNQFDGMYDQNIDLNELPAGTYFLTIEQLDKVYTEQLILK